MVTLVHEVHEYMFLWPLKYAPISTLAHKLHKYIHFGGVGSGGFGGQNEHLGIVMNQMQITS